MQVLCQYRPRKSKPRVKRNYASQTAINCDTFWLQSFGTRSLANTKIYVSVLFLLCFILYLRAISKNKPPGAYIWKGRFNGGFLWCYEFEGLRFWRGLYMEGLLSRILWYTAAVSQKSLCY